MKKRANNQTHSNGTKRLRVAYTQRGGGKQEVELEVPDTGDPEEEQVAEAGHFVQTLEDNDQLAEGPGPLPAGATHRIETGPDGGKRLVRKRFSFL